VVRSALEVHDGAPQASEHDGNTGLPPAFRPGVRCSVIEDGTDELAGGSPQPERGPEASQGEADVPAAGGPETTAGAAAQAELPADDAASGRRGRKTGSEPSRRSAWLVGIVAVLIIAALLGASWWAYQTVSERRLAAERVERATQLVEDADVVVIEVDEIIRTPIEVSVEARAEAALGLIPGARGDLEEAMSLVALAKPVLSDEDAPAAEALSESAEARLEMLEHGEPILEANIMAADAMGHAMTGWDLILEAEKLSDDAVKEYNKLTDDAVKQSKNLAADAKSKAEQVRSEFEAAQQAFPEADFSAYIAYADAKAAALAISIRADDAYLADEPAEANKFNDQYNDAEKALIEKAKALPESPVIPIKVAYETVASEPTEAYFEARARATASDSLLRGSESVEEE
jgi:hypothetical protein